ncbi:MAG: hypothetical protein CMH27_11560 [Micavibrio sp.]|nr:hypothetical protein [Micavibrio sp.]
MGSLTSRPKVPSYQQPQVVYVPQPAPSVAAPAPVPAPSDADGGEQGVKDAAEAREDNLLTRDRSRYGTVTTSFRGLLNLASGGTQKKTLLGE